MRNEPFIIEYELLCDVCGDYVGIIELPYKKYKNKVITNQSLGRAVLCDEHWES